MARDVMTAGIHCCREDDDLAKAVQHMESLKIRRLPVINKNKRMVGMLALGDIGSFGARRHDLGTASKAFPPITDDIFNADARRPELTFRRAARRAELSRPAMRLRGGRRECDRDPTVL